MLHICTCMCIGMCTFKSWFMCVCVCLCCNVSVDLFKDMYILYIYIYVCVCVWVCVCSLCMCVCVWMGVGGCGCVYMCKSIWSLHFQAMHDHHTPAYQELYEFLVNCFVHADTNMEGKVILFSHLFSHFLTLSHTFSPFLTLSHPFSTFLTYLTLQPFLARSHTS